jgi:cytochrome c-type biogenesis protein CcmF
MIPIGLFLLILTGVGPLFAWRRTSTESLRRNFAWPGIASLVLVGALIAAGMRDFYALISFGFCLFVAVTIIIEFFKGAKQIAAKNQFNFAHAVVELTHRNTRRYGGYVVHMGIVLMFVGFTGAAFNQNRIDEMKPGDSVRLGTYQLTVKATNEGENENYLWQKASVAVNKNGKFLGVLEPESRVYKASRQPTHEVAVRPRLNEDLYLNFAGMNGDRAVIQSYIFPLVSWIWIGALTLIFGTLVALVPSKVRREYARTQVVGITRKHATVEN